ncbi:MAG: hypothetical protein ACYSSI_12910 [Planctomycetota bacterium]|jgi:hypothetical protein
MVSEKETNQFFNSFLFPKIFQTFRMAIHPAKLTIGFSAIIIIWLCGWGMDLSRTVVISPDKTRPGKKISVAEKTELQVYMESPKEIKKHIEAYKKKGTRAGVFSTLWNFTSRKFHNTLISLSEFDIKGIRINILQSISALRWALKYHLVYCIIFLIVMLAVLGTAGGAICRISAMQFSRGEKLGLVEALKFSTKRFKSFFTVPLIPFGVIIILGLSIFVVGLICNIPRVGELITSILMPLVLIIGTFIAMVLIGTAAGFNLMIPAIAYDGSNCFDAISRSISYIFTKPWRMLFYTMVASIYGAICYLFARFFAFLLLFSSYLFLHFGVWIKSSNNQVDKLEVYWPKPSFLNLSCATNPDTMNWSESIASFLTHLSVLVVVGLLAAYLISFYFSVNTIIYSLMRNRVDNTKLEDIYIDTDNTDSEPAAATADSGQCQ